MSKLSSTENEIKIEEGNKKEQKDNKNETI